MKKRYYMLIFLWGMITLTVAMWIVKIMRGQLPYVDQWTRGPVDSFQDTYIFTFFRFITNFGSEFFMYPFTITVAIFLSILFRHWLPPLIFAGGTLVSHLFNKLIKFLVNRDRPNISIEANAEGHSFPSGHAMITLVCYGLLAFFICKKIQSEKAIFLIQITFTILIFLIGISRYFINVHYLTDIIAGFIIGYLLFIGFTYLYNQLEKRQTPT